MKKLLCVGLVVLSGCTALPKLATQLKGDPAVVDPEVVTLYGKGRLVRVGNNTNTVEIHTDGTVVVNPKR